ncbi:MAG: response regulator [Spirochaetales bacterium]|nr:response regulator [Spirochaetales bacterium]
MSDWPGIDLRGRTMLHPPWSSVKNASDRFPCYSSAIIEILSAFTNAGGSIDEMTELLNQHFPHAYEKLDSKELLNPEIHYSLEFHFYLVQFTKMCLNDQQFRYIIDENTQLNENHGIIEKGLLDFPPWIIDDGGLNDGYLSITNLSSLFLYVEEKYICNSCGLDSVDLGRRLALETIRFINRCVLEKYQIKRKFLEKEGILVSFEYMAHIGGILIALTNESRLFSIAHFYGFLIHNQLAKAIFLQPDISPVEGFQEWQRRTNNIYRMEFTSVRNTLYIKCNLKPSVQTGMFDLYRKHSIEKIKEAVPAVHRAFLELATGKKVKTKLIYDKTNDLSLTVRLRWHPPHSSYFTNGAAVLSMLIVMAVAVSSRAFLPQRTSFLIISVLLALITGGAAAAALNWRNKLKATRNRFVSSRKVIDRQLDSLKDTTNELLAEKELLDKKVRERTAELDEALEQLKKLDRSKTNFIANVSHELRTPLTLLTVPLEGIMSGRYGENLPVDHKVFKLMERNVKRLKTQINQLLDFARLDLGTMKYEPELIDIIGYCILLTAELESLAEQKGISLTVENNTGKEILAVCADKTLFETAVLNLLNNALKFTDKGGIKLILSSESDETVMLTVRDSGIGFYPEEKNRLFQRFTQAEEHKGRSWDGSGIGLALVAEIAEIHDWKIEAEGHPGEGASFSIIMPMQSERHSEFLQSELNPELRESRHERVESELVFYTAENVSESSDEKDTILLVEDNPDMGALLQNLLGKDYNLNWYTGGAEALCWLKTSPQVSLIICDVMMPKMSGFTFREELRRNGDYVNVPFIYLTALADAEDKAEGLKRGAVDYIQKPFTAAELIQKVKNLVDSHNASYQLAVRDSRGAERLNRIITNTGNEHSGPDWQTMGITTAEQRIVELVRQGLQDKEIAAELSISPRTVSSHLNHLYQKTNTQNRIELINLLYQ